MDKWTYHGAKNLMNQFPLDVRSPKFLSLSSMRPFNGLGTACSSPASSVSASFTVVVPNCSLMNADNEGKSRVERYLTGCSAFTLKYLSVG